MLRKIVIFTAFLLVTVLFPESFLLKIYAQELAINKEIAGMLQIRKLLEEKKFQELTSLLESYEADFEKGLSTEDKVSRAFDSFAITYSRYETLLNEWQQAFPKSFSPYLAQARYYQEVGWSKRGHDWARNTIDFQFQGMDENFTKAKNAASQALQLNPKLIKAYCILINIANAQGDKGKSALVKVALAFFPKSFLLRVTCMNCLLPRWGGSYEAMEEFASETEKFADDDPRLKLFKGFVYLDKASILLLKDEDENEDEDGKKDTNKDAAEALALCTKAFAYGEYWDFYSTRADAYWYLDKKQEVISDLNRSIALEPTNYYDYISRSKFLYNMERFKESLQDLRSAEALRPDKSNVKDRKAWMLKDLIYKGFKLYESKNLDQAMLKYDLALEIDPNHVEGLYWRGRVEVAQGDFDRALKDFNSAIKNDPHHFESYRNIDWLLAKNGNWDGVIQLWNGFIALEPNNEKAYLERGGAYYHKGDKKAALNDAKKSCELGNSEGCTRYNQLR